MTREEVQHLAALARIELTEAELEKFTTELSAVLSYVGKVNDLVGDEALGTSALGARHNVFREDVVTNTAGQYTADLLAEMPETDGQYMKVKKIIAND